MIEKLIKEIERQNSKNFVLFKKDVDYLLNNLVEDLQKYFDYKSISILERSFRTKDDEEFYANAKLIIDNVSIKNNKIYLSLYQYNNHEDGKPIINLFFRDKEDNNYRLRTFFKWDDGKCYQYEYNSGVIIKNIGEEIYNLLLEMNINNGNI